MAASSQQRPAEILTCENHTFYHHRLHPEFMPTDSPILIEPKPLLPFTFLSKAIEIRHAAFME